MNQLTLTKKKKNILSLGRKITFNFCEMRHIKKGQFVVMPALGVGRHLFVFGEFRCPPVGRKKKARLLLTDAHQGFLLKPDRWNYYHSSRWDREHGLMAAENIYYQPLSLHRREDLRDRRWMTVSGNNRKGGLLMFFFRDW